MDMYTLQEAHAVEVKYFSQVFSRDGGSTRVRNLVRETASDNSWKAQKLAAKHAEDKEKPDLLRRLYKSYDNQAKRIKGSGSSARVLADFDEVEARLEFFNEYSVCLEELEGPNPSAHASEGGSKNVSTNPPLSSHASITAVVMPY